MKVPTPVSACVRSIRDEAQIRRCKTFVSENRASLDSSARDFSACASPVRLAILRLLAAEGELCVCDLAEVLDISVPAVSQHLRKLKDAGAVSSRRAGNTIYHAASMLFPTGLAQTIDSLHEVESA